jgi:hypothetical protein
MTEKIKNMIGERKNDKSDGATEETKEEKLRKRIN